MRNGGRLLALLAHATFSLAQPLAAQTVTNVRATQLADKTVEVLYDLPKWGYVLWNWNWN